MRRGRVTTEKLKETEAKKYNSDKEEVENNNVEESEATVLGKTLDHLNF